MIAIAASPILTRVYSPENFNTFGLYLGISTILGAVTTGRYEMAILLPKKDNDAVNILGLSILVSMIVSSLIFLFLVITKFSNKSILEDTVLGSFIFLIPLSTLILGIYSSLNYWNNRRKNYNILSSGRITHSLLVALITVMLGFTILINSGLIFGTILGQGLAVIFLISVIIMKEKSYLKKINYTKIRLLSKRYFKFPKFLIAGHLMNTSSSQLPLILFSSYFISPVGGFFLLTQRVISLPISIISSSIGDVFRQQASLDFSQNKNCIDLYLSTFRKLVFISIIPFIAFYFSAPILFETVFGESWRKSGEFAQILVPMFFLQFVTSPLSNMFIIAEKQELDLLWQLFLFMSVLLSLSLGIFVFKDEFVAVALFSFSYSISYIVNFFMTLSFSKGKKN
ncbi:oligosaccharide flippase family protein [Candidatus Marinimicrobia bacterium]|nr:oligosaccharide flippase family protein [Candidatus Neomarinimicrobiota bacterium]